MHFDPEGIALTNHAHNIFDIILCSRGTMANGLLVLGGMGLLAVALVSVSLHKIEEGEILVVAVVD